MCDSAPGGDQELPLLFCPDTFRNYLYAECVRKADCCPNDFASPGCNALDEALVDVKRNT